MTYYLKLDSTDRTICNIISITYTIPHYNKYYKYIFKKQQLKKNVKKILYI